MPYGFKDDKSKYDLNELINQVENARSINVDAIYPVGSIYMSVNSTNPSGLFGGTWVQIKDTFLLSAGDSYKAGSTGGNATHRHSGQGDLRAAIGATNSSDIQIGYEANNRRPENQGPENATYAIKGTKVEGAKPFNHYTNVYGYTAPESSMPPYLTVYMWKRTG